MLYLLSLFHSVNITSLECENNTAVIDSDSNSLEGDNDDIDDIGDGDIDPNDTSVCATDGNTYRSVCHLLQNTVNVQVLHAGRCNDTKCRGGPVSLALHILLLIINFLIRYVAQMERHTITYVFYEHILTMLVLIIVDAVLMMTLMQEIFVGMYMKEVFVVITGPIVHS